MNKIVYLNVQAITDVTYKDSFSLHDKKNSVRVSVFLKETHFPEGG